MAKLAILKTLNETIKHAESFEAAVKDQELVNINSDSPSTSSIARISSYQRSKRETLQSHAKGNGSNYNNNNRYNNGSNYNKQRRGLYL